jgi:putative hydrolase of the HAD superfamily
MTISAILFDLDNTIYPASSGVMKGVDVRITEYVQNLLGIDLGQAQELRRHYYLTYGTTLNGLQRHHSVDAEDYLAYVHDIALENFLASDAELDHLLSLLAATKAIFTNSPAEHARRVLRVLGIERHFAHIFDIRFSGFRPKPDPTVYQSVLDTLGIAGREAILVEDTAQNLAPARALGMTAILIGEASDARAAESPRSEGPADYVVPDVLAAMRVALELERAG